MSLGAQDSRVKVVKLCFGKVQLEQREEAGATPQGTERAAQGTGQTRQEEESRRGSSRGERAARILGGLALRAKQPCLPWSREVGWVSLFLH